MPGVLAEQPAVKARKPTKNEQRRAKKKQQKQEISAAPSQTDVQQQPEKSAEAAAPAGDAADNELTIVEVDNDLPADDALLSQFADVLARFNQSEDDAKENEAETKAEVFYDDDDNVQSEDEEEATKKRLTKKQRKAASKLSIAELKAIVRKPEIVEWTDTDAADPKLLVNLKSARNVIPVPNHWSLKREYLSSKRGIEKPGFVLPKFIVETGITEMRDAAHAKEAEATLKQKQRERVSGKTGKLDIDYQKLYEAFFRRQTKPSMTKYGEVYYEGKEFETNLRHLRPGQLSEELMEALNMGPGAPPPWLVAQQKVGPPPSYPALKIPGLNAPPPVGSSWGYAPGQWGKPPLDAEGRPEWGGDVFGLTEYQEDAAKDDTAKVEPVDKSLWGELQEPEEEEEEEEEEDEEEEDEEEDDSGRRTGIDGHYSGTDTPAGFASTVPTDFMGMRGMSDDMNLRKDRVGTETEASNHPRSAGQVLNERSIRAEGFFGGERAYDLSGGRSANGPVLGSERDDRGRKRKVGDLDVSMDPDALARDDKMSKEELRRRFEAESAQQNRGGWKGAESEDLSGLVAEETVKRQKRDRERAQRGGGGGGGGRR